MVIALGQEEVGEVAKAMTIRTAGAAGSAPPGLKQKLQHGGYGFEISGVLVFNLEIGV